MLYNIIYNPITNNYVNVHSKYGKEILQKYLIGGSSSKLQLLNTPKNKLATLYKKNIEKKIKLNLINEEIFSLIEQLFGHRLRTNRDISKAQNYLKEQINKNLNIIKLSKNKGVELTKQEKNNIQYTFIKQFFILVYLVFNMESQIKNLVEILTQAGYDVSKYLNNKSKYLTNLYGGAMSQNPFVIPEDQEDELGRIVGMSKKKKTTKSQRKKIQKEKLQKELEKQKRLNEFKKRVAYLNSLPSYEEQLKVTPRNTLGKPDFNTPEGYILHDILLRDKIQPLFEVYKEDKTSAEQRRELYENVLPLPTGYDDSDVPEFSYKMNELFASETAKNIVQGIQILNEAIGMVKNVQSFVDEFRPSDGQFLPPEIEAQIPAYSTGRNAIIPKYVKNVTSEGNTSSMFSYALNVATDLNEKFKKADPFKIGPPGAAAQETTDGKCLSGDCESGYGIYQMPSGAIYEGNHKYGGLRHGKGKYTKVDGSVIEGEFKYGQPVGQAAKQREASDARAAAHQSSSSIETVTENVETSSTVIGHQPNIIERMAESTKDVHQGIDSVAKTWDYVMGASVVEDSGTLVSGAIRTLVNLDMATDAACAATAAFPFSPITPWMVAPCATKQSIKLARGIQGVANVPIKKLTERAEAKRTGQEVPAMITTGDVIEAGIHGLASFDAHGELFTKHADLPMGYISGVAGLTSNRVLYPEQQLSYYGEGAQSHLTTFTTPSYPSVKTELGKATQEFVIQPVVDGIKQVPLTGSTAGVGAAGVGAVGAVKAGVDADKKYWDERFTPHKLETIDENHN